MRCEICDYVEGYGSDMMNIPAAPNIRVLRHPLHGVVCTHCLDAIQEAVTYEGQEEEENLELDEDAPAVS